MKKILSIILAISMTLSLIGGVAFASSASDPEVYGFTRESVTAKNSGLASNWQNSKQEKNGEVWWDPTDASLGDAGGTRVSNMKGFADHGWKWFDINNEALDSNGEIPAANTILGSTYLRLQVSTTSYKVTAADGLEVGFALKTPATPAFYKTSIDATTRGDASWVKCYLSNEIPETAQGYKADKIKNYVNSARLVHNLQLRTPGVHHFENLVYLDANDSDELVFVTKQSKKEESTNQGIQLNSLTFTRVDVSDITLTATKTSLEIGGTTNLTTTATLSEGDPMPMVHSFVTYTVTGDTAAIEVAEDGKVTAKAAGTATITAMVGDLPPSSIEITVEGEEEDETLTGAFNPTPEPVTQYSPSVEPLKYVDGVESTVKEISVSATDTDEDGTYSVSTSTTDASYNFLYWIKGKSTSKIIVSRTASFDYTPGNGDVNYLIAVYEKDGAAKNKAEFYNANGQLIEAIEGATVTVPALPSMAGYGTASAWVNADGDKYSGGESVDISGTVMFIAEYAEPTTTYSIETTKCETDKTSYKYGELVTCTATGTAEDGTFKCWMRDGEIVSTNPTYTFSAWKNHKVEAVYVTEDFTFTGVAQKIIVEIFGDNVMAEFIGFTNVVEKGIILGTQEIAMTTGKTQFTVENNVGATTAKGYVIVKDGNSFKKYTDGEISLSGN